MNYLRDLQSFKEYIQSRLAHIYNDDDVMMDLDYDDIYELFKVIIIGRHTAFYDYILEPTSELVEYVQLMGGDDTNHILLNKEKYLIISLLVHNFEFFIKLFETGSEINVNRFLFYAIITKSFPIIRYLIEWGAKWNDDTFDEDDTTYASHPLYKIARIENIYTNLPGNIDNYSKEFAESIKYIDKDILKMLLRVKTHNISTQTKNIFKRRLKHLNQVREAVYQHPMMSVELSEHIMTYYSG